MQILYSREHFGWSLNHSKRGREKICKEFLYKDFITMSDLEILCKVISYAFLLSTLWVNYLNIWPKNFLQDKCTCFFHKHSKISMSQIWPKEENCIILMILQRNPLRLWPLTLILFHGLFTLFLHPNYCIS